jgi:hypothetical protein
MKNKKRAGFLGFGDILKPLKIILLDSLIKNRKSDFFTRTNSTFYEFIKD